MNVTHPAHATDPHLPAHDEESTSDPASIDDAFDAQGESGSRKIPSYYEMKVRSKRMRYLELAEKAEAEAENRMRGYQRIADGIPPGQPIIVGHYSEKRHRRDIERMHTNVRKSVEADKKANFYAEKAENYGTHCISAENPEAISLLEQQIRKLEQQKEQDKLVNKELRRKDRQKARENLKALGIPEDVIDRLLEGGRDLCFPTYHFQNINQKIKQKKDRIKALKRTEKIPEVNEETDHYDYEQCHTVKRVIFRFPEKPPEPIRACLKSNGFHFNKDGSWTRLLNMSAVYAANRIKTVITNHYTPPSGESA